FCRGGIIGIFPKTSRSEFYIFLMLIFVASSAIWAHAQGSALGPAQPMPPEKLLALFQHELGNLYRADGAENLLAAHEAMEKYFAAPSSDERKAIVSALELLNIDPNLLGRLTRIRSRWPELTPGGVYYINERIGPLDVHYFLGVPKRYTRASAWPLVVKLPTA